MDERCIKQSSKPAISKPAPESPIVTAAQRYAANQQRIAFLRQEQGRIQQAIEDNIIEAHELRARLITLVEGQAS
ncbi:MAG TPA: hypothetical protein VFZ66_29545 [Herpetosiphonaceae bacterium]